MTEIPPWGNEIVVNWSRKEEKVRRSKNGGEKEARRETGERGFAFGWSQDSHTKYFRNVTSQRYIVSEPGPPVLPRRRRWIFGGFHKIIMLYLNCLSVLRDIRRFLCLGSRYILCVPYAGMSRQRLCVFARGF